LLRPAPLIGLLAAGLLALGCAVARDGPGESTDDDAPTIFLDGVDLARELAESPSREAPAAFRRLAVTWTSSSPGALEISTSEDGVSWSRWRAPVVRHTEVEEASSFLGELDLGDRPVRYYRIRGTREQRPQSAALTFLSRPISAELEEGHPPTYQRMSRSVALGSVEVQPREAWGARAPRCRGGALTPTRITIHHTASPNQDSDTRSRLRHIQQFHIHTRGWCDIGYHFLVARDGQVWEGRPLSENGSHVLNNNSGNVGIALIGNFMGASPTEAQLAASARVIAELSRTYGIAIDTDRIKGHKAMRSTECPGRVLDDALPQLIARARSEATGDPGPGPDPPRDPPGAAVVRGVVFEAGTPTAGIGGATVTVGDRHLVADARGAFHTEVAPGLIAVSAAASGFLTRSVTVQVQGGETWSSIGLSPAGELAGTAALQGTVRGEGARRVPGATVFIEGVAAASADEHGFFRLTDLPPGTHTVRAAADGFGVGQVTRQLANDSMEWADITLPAAGQGAGEGGVPQVQPPSCAGLCASVERVPGSDPACYCDPACEQNGDCCPGRAAACAAEPVPASPSCAGRCSSAAAVIGEGRQCYCDPTCLVLDDCCDDRARVCEAALGPTCAGRCDTGAPIPTAGVPCYCDAGCQAKGDCCPDRAAVCSGSCAGSCGSTEPIELPDGRVCYCDAVCAAEGDCCSDFADSCQP
jgi:hypothetical protein